MNFKPLLQQSQSVVSCFHAAIDFEQENNNIGAYKKYAEGLAAIGTMLHSDAHLLHQAHVSSRHLQMLEFAKRSTDRLQTLLKTFGNDAITLSGDCDSANNNSCTTYQKLSQTLPEIVTETPRIPVSIPDEISAVYSPLSSVEEDNKRLTRMYENRLTSLMNPAAKADLKLELERRLAENNALARKRFEDWEKRRQILASECHRIAEEKFYIREKIRSGTVDESDFTKQTLYATCLQFHQEHIWAREYSCKLLENINNENNVKKFLNLFLQNGSYPLAFMLRKIREKTTNKLSFINPNQTFCEGNEKYILDEHFKNIARDTKDDLFVLITVMRALWEPLNNESGQLLIIDVLHHLYFPTAKPYFIQLLRISLHREEDEIAKCMRRFSQSAAPYPTALNSVIVKLHQLTATHSPSAMMTLLVEILRSLIDANNVKLSNDDSVMSISVGVDQLMPKLIELILFSNMVTLPAEISFVENFMPAQKALGEEGYAVTLFQSVLSFIFVNSDSLANEINTSTNP